MQSVLPPKIPIATERESISQASSVEDVKIIKDVDAGIQKAPMSIRLTPHILSLIDWHRPLSDPIFRQFIPLGSRIRPDHPQLRLDSLDERADAPVPGLVHRYPDKVLFLCALSPSICFFLGS